MYVTGQCMFMERLFMDVTGQCMFMGRLFMDVTGQCMFMERLFMDVTGSVHVYGEAVHVHVRNLKHMCGGASEI